VRHALEGWSDQEEPEAVDEMLGLICSSGSQEYPFRNNMDDWKSPARYHFDFSTLINSFLDAFEPTGDIEICPS